MAQDFMFLCGVTGGHVRNMSRPALRAINTKGRSRGVRIMMRVSRNQSPHTSKAAPPLKKKKKKKKGTRINPSPMGVGTTPANR